MSISQRAPRFKEIGKLVSIKPSSGTPMTAFESFEITTTVQPANVMHARDPILKPGTETALDANATFFAPVESYGADGVPQFKQFVVNGNIGSAATVSTYEEYFTVTDPGVMGTEAFYSVGANDGQASVTPRALSQPTTRRRKGTVTVSLTTSNTADAEVAYNDNGVEFCGISFVTFYSGATNSSASISSSYRTFNKYLRTTDATYPSSQTATATSAGVYNAVAKSTATGDLTYTTTGIYRSQVTPFLRRADGTQYYLKTNVTFS